MFLRPWLGPFVSRLVLPAQNYPNVDQLHVDITKGPIHLRHQHIDSTNGARIQIGEFVRSSNASVNQDQKVIIHATGNADFFENHTEEFAMQATRIPNARVVGFNFRGVLTSTGQAQSENDWVEDAIAVIEHYRRLGIRTENILLSGQSLGAALLTRAAAVLHQRDFEAQRQQNPNVAKEAIPAVKILNQRSFSTLQEVVMGILGGLGTGLITSAFLIAPLLFWLSVPPVAAIAMTYLSASYFIPAIPKFFLRPLLRLTLWAVFGNVDALSAYNALPEQAKDHIVAKDDGLIVKPAGLHEGLKSQLRAQKAQLRERLQNHADDHVARDALLNIKDSGLYFNHGARDHFDAHVVDMGQLRTHHGLRTEETALNGAQVEENKIRRLLAIPAR